MSYKKKGALTNRENFNKFGTSSIIRGSFLSDTSKYWVRLGYIRII